jgi:hypothetical protein
MYDTENVIWKFNDEIFSSVFDVHTILCTYNLFLQIFFKFGDKNFILLIITYI